MTGITIGLEIRQAASKILDMASTTVRSVLSVLAGWATVGALVVATDAALAAIFPGDYIAGRLPPDSLAAASLATSTIWSVAGGWVTARLAPFKPWHHILGLILWGELLGFVSAALTWGQTQLWYQAGLLIMWTPAVFLGGWLRAGKPRFRTASAS